MVESSRRFGKWNRVVGALGLVAGLTTVAGCMAVGNAETLSSPSGHRSTGSIISSVAGSTTSDMTSAFPSSTTSKVVDATAPANQDGDTRGDLSKLAPNANWTVKLGDALAGLRLGSFFGSDEISPLQVGNVMMVSLNSSVLNTAGTAAFSMTDGSLLWQDRSLECQRVDLGGALPCRQNSGAWAPLNPATGTFGEAINPGFAPEIIGFHDGVLYSARSNGSGMMEIAAGTVASPAELWTVSVPRAAEAMIPGEGAEITVSDTVVVRLGAAQIELTKDGVPTTPEAHLVSETSLAHPTNSQLDASRTIGENVVVNTADDRLAAFHDGRQIWEIPARIVDKHSVSDGKAMTVVRGSDAGNVLTTVSLADGAILDERTVVADAAQPKSVQSAGQGLFHVDKQFSTISYYSA